MFLVTLRHGRSDEARTLAGRPKPPSGAFGVALASRAIVLEVGKDMQDKGREERARRRRYSTPGEGGHGQGFT